MRNHPGSLHSKALPQDRRTLLSRKRLQSNISSSNVPVLRYWESHQKGQRLVIYRLTHWDPHEFVIPMRSKKARGDTFYLWSTAVVIKRKKWGGKWLESSKIPARREMHRQTKGKARTEIQGSPSLCSPDIRWGFTKMHITILNFPLDTATSSACPCPRRSLLS